jgi:competence ComEA-like helix-hairpin-helix protein
MQRLIVFIVLGIAILFGVVAQAAPSASTPLEINQASLSQLLELPGIGQHRATAIIDYRVAHPFRRPADLMRIKGIGRRIFLKLKPFVTVAEPATAGQGPQAPMSATRAGAGTPGAPPS